MMMRDSARIALIQPRTPSLRTKHRHQPLFRHRSQAGASPTAETNPASAVVSRSAPTATHPVNPPKEEGTPTGSTLGILGLVIGILSCVILFVMGPQAVLPAIIALVLCLVSLQKREVGASRAPAIVGLCFSAFALFNALAFFGCVSMMIGTDNSLRLLGMPV